MGLKNTLGSCKLEEKYLQQFVDMCNGRIELHNDTEFALNRPGTVEPPGEDVQNMLHNHWVNNLRPTKKEEAIPWWMRMVCRNSGPFSNCALVLPWDQTESLYPPIIHIIAFTCEQPLTVHFCEEYVPPIHPFGNSFILEQSICLMIMDVAHS